MKQQEKIITYSIDQLIPYINWLYFFHAWSLNGKPEEEKQRLKSDAMTILQEWQDQYCTKAIFKLCEAYGDGDDLLVEGTRIPLLRQQHAVKSDQPNLCLSDFVRPLHLGIPDTIGLFATTTDPKMATATSDPYQSLLRQTLADRLAEATAEKVHLDVRTLYWGYAPDEKLSIPDLLAEKYQGIRPAVGYPSLPDAGINFILHKMLRSDRIGISLTESGMMIPHASVSGLMIAHPQSRYFFLGTIGEDQFADYAQRRGMSKEELRPFLQANLRN